MSTEENTDPIEEVIRNFSDLTKAAEDHAAPALYISRRYARALLDYIAELEAKVPEEIDNVSDLKVGDTVKTLIDYTFHKRGEFGTVEGIFDDTYPIKILFGGAKYPVGYKRFELGKVAP